MRTDKLVIEHNGTGMLVRVGSEHAGFDAGMIALGGTWLDGALTWYLPIGSPEAFEQAMQHLSMWWGERRVWQALQQGLVRHGLPSRTRANHAVESLRALTALLDDVQQREAV